VAPLFEGERERRVLLPPGAWYDFHTGAQVGVGPGEVTVAADLATVPVLVRDGGIVPLMPPLPHAPTSGQKVDLEVRHYGRAAGSFVLYDDDGETLAYERGEWCRIRLEARRDETGQWTGRVGLPEGQRTVTYASFTWRFMGDRRAAAPTQRCPSGA